MGGHNELVVQYMGGAFGQEHGIFVYLLCANQLRAEKCLYAEVCLDAVENHLLITVSNVLMGADFF